MTPARFDWLDMLLFPYLFLGRSPVIGHDKGNRYVRRMNGDNPKYFLTFSNNLLYVMIKTRN